MITLEQIKEMHEEKKEIEMNNLGYIKMMLNKEEKEAYNEFFVNENDYIAYKTNEIVEIPYNFILDSATQEKGWILEDDEAIEAIWKWCNEEIEK